MRTLTIDDDDVDVDDDDVDDKYIMSVATQNRNAIYEPNMKLNVLIILILITFHSGFVLMT